MKRKLLSILFCCIVVAGAFAQYPQTLPITHTSFFATTAMGTNPTLEKGSYSTSTDAILVNQWNRSSATTGGSSPTVENSTLSYSNYVDNNAGKAIILADGNLNRRSVYSLSNTNPYTGTDFYLGLLVKVSSITATGYLITWDANHTSTTVRGAVLVRADADGFNFGMSTTNSTVSTWSGKLSFDQTHFIVLKVKPISGGANVAYTFYVNPTIDNSEAQSTALSSNIAATGGLQQIRAIAIQQASGINAKIAGLRFSDKWADVVRSSTYTENFVSATVDGNLEGYDSWAVSTNTSWDDGTSPLIGATPLVYPDYLGSNNGRVAITNKNNTARASVKLTSVSAPVDGTSVYASFLVKIDDQNTVTTGLREIFVLNQSLGEYTRCRVSAQHFPADNTVKFAVSKVTTKSDPSIAFNAANTHLLVLKYNRIAGANNDKISLYINPDLTLKESEQVNSIVDFEDANQIDWGTAAVHLLIRQTGIGAKFGGFRVGTTWEQVIPASSSVTVNNSSSISAYNLNTSSQLNVATGATLTIDDDTEVDAITAAPGAKVTLADTKTLSGTLTLQSDENGTATFVDNYNAPTVNAVVQQRVTSGRNWYMSTPLSAANASVLNRGTSVVEYNEATGLWPTASTLTPGKGYIQVAAPTEGSTGNVEFTGITNSGNIPVTLTYHSETGKGFNLVGNPYPSYLDWSAVATDLINTNATTGAKMPTGTMWYRTINYNGKSEWQPNHDYNILNEIVYNGTRFYKVTTAGTSAATGGPSGSTTSIVDNTVTWAYEGSIYIFATVSAGGQVSPSTVSNLVPPMQAFWVKSTGGTLTFKNTMRSHKTDVGSNLLKAPKSTTSEMPLVRLSVTNGVSADEAVIYASANASNVFDSYDAPKYFNTESYNQPEIFTQVGNEKLAINALSELSEGMELPLGFATSKGNDFSIAATELKNLGSDLQVILKDKQSNNAEFNLTNGKAYNFSSSAVNDANRFTLIFRAPSVTTGVENTNKFNAQVFVNAANQITISAPEKSNYAIYNAMGQLIENGILNYNLHTVNYKLTQGVYVVKVNNQTTRVIIK